MKNSLLSVPTAAAAGLARCRACGQLSRLQAPASDGAAACPRCGAVLHLRQPASVARTWAYLSAAAVLYVPANVLPVMKSGSLFGVQEDTILSGVVFLWRDGSWFLAALVFVASIVVPLAKLLVLAFLLLYRFAEAQLVKLAAPFMLDSAELGGLALNTGQVGFAYGTIGVVMLTLGGLLGGFLAARNGLKFWLLWMVIAINLPNAVYIFLSSALPENLLIINLAVGVEQFGYGFGFAAYMLYMLYVSSGAHQTAHYAICTGFMALGMMIPGMFSGWLQELLGYQYFFIWVMVATLPSFIVTLMIPLDRSFGRKEDTP